MEEQLLASIHRRANAELKPETVVVFAKDLAGMPVVRSIRPLPSLDPDFPHDRILSDGVRALREAPVARTFGDALGWIVGR